MICRLCGKPMSNVGRSSITGVVIYDGIVTELVNAGTHVRCAKKRRFRKVKIGDRG
jgi:hypothetical protein